MAKLLKSLGKTLKKNNQTSNEVEGDDTQDITTLQRSRYCGWSALIDLPQRRRNSEAAQRLANHDFKCKDKLKEVFSQHMHISHSGCCNSLYTANNLPKVNIQTRASISFDICPPKLLDFYSDPIDLRNDKFPPNKSPQVTISDEDYSVPYQCHDICHRDIDLQTPRGVKNITVFEISQLLFVTGQNAIHQNKVLNNKEATYEEPWDLSSTEQNLFNRLTNRASSNMLTSCNSSPITTNTLHQCLPTLHHHAHLSDDHDKTLTRDSELLEDIKINMSPSSMSPICMMSYHHRCCNHISHHRHYSYRLTKQERQNMMKDHKCISAPQMIIHQKEIRSKKIETKVDPPVTNDTMEEIERKIMTNHPLNKHSWFHGLMSRQEAELLLRDTGEGSYLVRISESNNNDYSLSLRSDSGYLHIKIIISTNNMYILGQFSQPFDSIASIIDFFACNKLPIKGTHHILLTHPIPYPSLQ